MNIDQSIVQLANDLRAEVQAQTETVSDGEGVAMVLLWTFLMDHARVHNLDVNELARGQLEAFIEHAADAFEYVPAH